MYHYTVSQWLIFFMMYCFVGWCLESTWVSIQKKRLVNRGFLSGPVIPIYGFGAIAILFVVLPVRNSVFLVFLLGGLSATVLEYGTGVVMEAIFGVRYWDYSDKPCNLKGHICLESSLAWGLLSIVLIRILHQRFELLVGAMPELLLHILVLLLVAVFAADFALSVKTALEIKTILRQLARYSEKAKEELHLVQRRVEITAAFRLDSLENFLTEKVGELPGGGESIRRKLEDLESALDHLEQTAALQKLKTDLAVLKAHRSASWEELKARVSRGHRRMLRNNPGARSRRYAAEMTLLQQTDQQEKGPEKAKTRERSCCR